MPATANPISIAQNALERWLINQPGMQEAMGLGIEKNTVALNKGRDAQELDVRSESDFPRLELVPIGGPWQFAASNRVEVDWSWRITIYTGDMRVTEAFSVMVFAVVCACTTALDPNSLGGLVGLRWKDRPFIDDLRLTNVTSGLSVPQENRGIKGMSAVCDLTAHMSFAEEHLKEFNNGS